MKAHVKPVFPTPAERERFQREEAALSLRWRCPDCAHYAPTARTCSLEYPNQGIRDGEGYTDPQGNYRFCKYFEAT